MPTQIHLGRYLSAFAMIALGIVGLLPANFLMEWTPAPAQVPARAAWAYLHGAVLILAGLGLFVNKTVRLAALTLGSVWLVWMLLHIPPFIASWRGGLGGVFETLAMSSGLFLLAAVAAPQTASRIQILIPRYAFAFSLPMLGTVHFLYPAAVAAFIPAWIPARLFFAYFTGVALCAAGLAILFAILSRLAALLFALMLTSWVLILHIPRVLHTPADRHEWITLLIAIALTANAWTLSGSLAPDNKSDRPAPVGRGTNQ
jgi:uncharacterized membrane protein YphA (DoxX/SURF4 family)